MNTTYYRYRYCILYCNFYLTLKFKKKISIVFFDTKKITMVCSVFGRALRVTENVHSVHRFLYHSFVHALRPRQLSFSAQVFISAIDCAFQAVSGLPHFKVRAACENREEGRVHSVAIYDHYSSLSVSCA